MKLLDASRDGKETERQLRSALQEALDEMQALQRRQRELARAEKEMQVSVFVLLYE